MKKKLLICFGLILAFFACITITAYADDIVWTEMQDTSHLGQYGSIYYRLNDNGPYYCADIINNETSISFTLDDFVGRVKDTSASIDLYIYIREDIWQYFLKGNISANFPELDSFELYPNGHELLLESSSECVKCNCLKIIGNGAEDSHLKYGTKYYFEANSCVIEDVSIAAFSYIPFIQCVKDGGEYKFTDVMFYGSYGGKVIDIEAPNVKVQMDNCNFGTEEFPSDVEYGDYGAIYVNASNAVIEGNTSGIKENRTSFYGCKADDYGGAIVSFANNTTIKGFNFNNCNAEYGGAIYSDDGCTDLNVSDCDFTGNKTGNDGGAIYVSGTSFHVSNCVFTDNESGDCGGAIHSDQEYATIENCIFKGNKSSDHGGAVYATDYYVTVKNCSFYGNKTDSCGGGLYINEDTDTVENCAFANNNAYDSNSGYGKSLYLDDKDGITLKTCKFGGSYSDEIYFKWGHTPAKENCEENLGANNFDNWGYFWQNQNTGSFLSNGSVWVIVAISAAALGVVAVMLEKKKRTA